MKNKLFNMRLLLAALTALVLLTLLRAGTPAVRGQDSGTFVMASNNVPVLFTNTAPSATVFTISSIASGYWIYLTAASGSTTNSASEPLTATFGVSYDGTAYTTNRSVFQSSINPSVTNALYFSVLPNGTNLQTSRCYIDMRGARFLKWLTAENPAGGGGTNYWTNMSAQVVAGTK